MTLAKRKERRRTRMMETRTRPTVDLRCQGEMTISYYDGFVKEKVILPR